jgi:outer membrane protein assembly factor BamC
MSLNKALRTVLAASLVGLSGCAVMFGPEGVFPSRSMDYKRAIDQAPLQLPEGMASVQRTELYPIPDITPPDAVFDPGDSDDVPRPDGLLSVNVDAGVELRGSGDSRWLVVKRDADSARVAVRNFLDSNGFREESEDVAAGTIETGWLRPREEQRPGVLKRLFTLNFRDDYDKFRFRIDGQPQGTLVYVEQARESVFSADNLPERVDWSSDREEHALAEVMAGDLADFIAEEQANSIRTGVLASAYANAPRTIMTSDGNGFPVLVVTLDMNRAWLVVGDALEKTEIKVRDFDRSLGVYYLPRAPSGETRNRDDDEDEDDEDDALDSDQYQLKLLRADEGVHLSVQLNDNTLAPADEAKRLLEALRRYIQ